ncbi:cobalamin biosynthesis protein [Antarctobacter jejuensis]|uniref:cobalamin biosynthesis protein n=1 Tax=Antarctobacter jejuensis TaxID=1439938 RepID=UPI003FD63617
MIFAGFGFRASATEDSLTDALRQAARNQMVSGLATASEKAASPVFQALAQTQDLPVIAIDSTRLAAQETATNSTASMAAHGTGSVAEAAALAAAGRGARLLGPRVVSGDRQATCALAEGEGI